MDGPCEFHHLKKAGNQTNNTFWCQIQLGHHPVVVKEEDKIGEHVEAVGEGPDGEREEQDPKEGGEPVDVK